MHTLFNICFAGTTVNMIDLSHFCFEMFLLVLEGRVELILVWLLDVILKLRLD